MLPLGLPHGGAVQPLNYVLEHWAKSSKIDLLRWALMMGPRSGPENAAEMGSQHPSPNVKNLCNFEKKLSHHVMPKVLVLKAPRCHVQKKIWRFLAKFWAENTTSCDGCVIGPQCPRH